MNLFVEELKEINEADLLTLESLMNQLTGRTVKLSREYIDGIKAGNSPVKLYVIRKEGVIIAKKVGLKMWLWMNRTGAKD